MNIISSYLFIQKLTFNKLFILHFAYNFKKEAFPKLHIFYMYYKPISNL